MIDTFWNLLRDHLGSWKNNSCIKSFYDAFGYTAPELMEWTVFIKYGATKEGNQVKFVIPDNCLIILTQNTIYMEDNVSKILITRTEDDFTIV